MSADWPIATIADCALEEPYSTQIGPFGDKIRAATYTSAGAPVLRGVNVNGAGRFFDDGFAFVSEETAQNEFAKFVCRSGDVILCHKGTLGKIGILPEKTRYPHYIMGNSMMKVRCNPSKLLPLYLYYWLCSSEGQHYLFSRVSQVGVPQIHRPLSTLREARIPLPPLVVQSRIVDVLGALDDKIELNLRTSETLEATIRAVFKSWFVDFDPVWSNVTGRQLQGTAVASLFPSSFDDSGGSRIPAGWRIVPLGELASLQRGTTYQSRLLGLPGPVLLGLGSIRPGGGFRTARLKTYGGECRQNLILNPGDVYVALKGATKDGSMVGSIARVPPSVASGRLTQDTVKLVFESPKSGVAQFVYWALRMQHYRDYCALRATGSAQVGLSRRDFLSYRVVLPPREVLAAFAQLDDSLSERGYLAEAESTVLSSLRDALLPKLLSGEMRVRDAEREVERVA